MFNALLVLHVIFLFDPSVPVRPKVHIFSQNNGKMKKKKTMDTG